MYKSMKVKMQTLISKAENSNFTNGKFQKFWDLALSTDSK